MLKKTIDQILPGTAARLPDKTALIFGDRKFTYRQLERRRELKTLDQDAPAKKQKAEAAV